MGPESSDEDLPKGPTTPGDQSPSMGPSMVTIKQEGDEDVKPKLAMSTCGTRHLK